LDYLQSLVLNFPDLTIERVADEDDEESEQREGYVIDIGGCDPARVWGTTLRETIDLTMQEEEERAKG
jgi:hypothetical protein